MNTPILNEKDLPLDQLKEIGLEKNGEATISRKDIIALLSGGRTNLIRLRDIERNGVEIKEMDVKLSLVRGVSGKPDLLIHPVYKQSLSPSYLSSAEADQLITGEKANLLKEVDRDGEKKSLLVEYDWDTKEFVVTDTSRLQAPEQVNGITLSPYQKERYSVGRQIELGDGSQIQASMTSAEGIRSNKLNLIVSILMDGGLSYLLLAGIKAMIGEKGLLPQSADKSNEYKNTFKEYEKQQMGRLGDMLGRSNEGGIETRGYTRSGMSR